jgi:class 3 adenylate cyclase
LFCDVTGSTALGESVDPEALRALLARDRDVATESLWRQVEALVLARRERHAEAEALAQEAVAITETTDGLNWQGDALCENLAMVAQVRPRLEALRGQTAAT